MFKGLKNVKSMASRKREHSRREKVRGMRERLARIESLQKQEMLEDSF